MNGAGAVRGGAGDIPPWIWVWAILSAVFLFVRLAELATEFQANVAFSRQMHESLLAVSYR